MPECANNVATGMTSCWLVWTNNRRPRMWRREKQEAAEECSVVSEQSALQCLLFYEAIRQESADQRWVTFVATVSVLLGHAVFLNCNNLQRKFSIFWFFFTTVELFRWPSRDCCYLLKIGQLQVLLVNTCAKSCPCCWMMILLQ